jgi:hypothetical protein
MIETYQECPAAFFGAAELLPRRSSVKAPDFLGQFRMQLEQLPAHGVHCVPEHGDARFVQFQLGNSGIVGQANELAEDLLLVFPRDSSPPVTAPNKVSKPVMLPKDRMMRFLVLVWRHARPSCSVICHIRRRK